MIVDPDRLMTAALRRLPWGEQVARVLAASLDAVDPAQAVLRNMHRHGDTLRIGQKDYHLDQFEHIWLVGAGKAGAPMARAAVQVLDGSLNGGAIIVKDGYIGSRDWLPSNLDIFEAAHPVPDERGVSATQRILEILDGAGAHDLVICLISGGGSALLTAPVDGISLSDLAGLTTALLASGADIAEINTLRKHLDRVKGGGLAKSTFPAALASLILSDVISSPLDAIASGPTVPDKTTFADTIRIIERYELYDAIPESIVDHLRRGFEGLTEETPKPGDPIFNNVQNTVIAENLTAAHAGLDQARREGFQPMLLTTFLSGEARYAGRALAAIARQIRLTGEPIAPPACLIAGGETTVTLRGDGLGGRNQELALGALEELAGLAATVLVALATDGGDGPTDAAGAVVSGESLDKARAEGLIPQHFLARNDSYHFFEPLGDLLLPGPTNTNVNDLAFLFIR